MSRDWAIGAVRVGTLIKFKGQLVPRPVPAPTPPSIAALGVAHAS